MPKGVYIRKSNIKYGMTDKKQSEKWKKTMKGNRYGFGNKGNKGKKQSPETIARKILELKEKGYRGNYPRQKLEIIAGRKKPEQCELCGAMGQICYDHNHETGKFRGWICKRCNSVLGYVKDNCELLEALIKYLKK